jgi:hypothetical protein
MNRKHVTIKRSWFTQPAFTWTDWEKPVHDTWLFARDSNQVLPEYKSLALHCFINHLGYFVNRQPVAARKLCRWQHCYPPSATCPCQEFLKSRCRPAWHELHPKVSSANHKSSSTVPALTARLKVHVSGRAGPDLSKDRSAFIFRDKQSKNLQAFRTSVAIYQSTQRNIEEDFNLQGTAVRPSNCTLHLH